MKQIRIVTCTEKGESEALMLVVLPKTGTPVPVVYGLSFSPVHTALTDDQILLSYSAKKLDESTRGASTEAWCIEEAVSRGYGVAIASYEDFAPDNTRTWKKRVISLFDQPDFKAISAWAFGLMRMADYLETEPAVDAQRLILCGTSRLGKTSLWAGANDERAAAVIATVSGTCGAAMSRDNHKEKLSDLAITFRWQLIDGVADYADREADLPIDQHELLACIAPRKVYLSSAEVDNSDDAQGGWNALMLARDAFRVHGLEVIEDGDVNMPLPSIGTRVFTDSMAYHQRTGNHGITPEDWGNYLDYLDEYLH